MLFNDFWYKGLQLILLKLDNVIAILFQLQTMRKISIAQSHHPTRCACRIWSHHLIEWPTFTQWREATSGFYFFLFFHFKSRGGGLISLVRDVGHLMRWGSPFNCLTAYDDTIVPPKFFSQTMQSIGKQKVQNLKGSGDANKAGQRDWRSILNEHKRKSRKKRKGERTFEMVIVKGKVVLRGNKKREILFFCSFYLIIYRWNSCLQMSLFISNINKNHL